MIREKKIKSGKLLEVDFYPVFSDGRRLPIRGPRTNPTKAEQEKYNRLQAVKKLVRLVNANFDNGDYWTHPTFIPHLAPQSEKEARKIITNYLRRVKTRRNRELKRAQRLLEKNPDDERLKKQKEKLEQEFKYIYVLEKQTYKTGPYAGRNNWHYHLFMTGGVDRDILEDMWDAGIRVNIDRFQPEDFGPEAAAKYMSKNPIGSKRFCCSKNLKKPATKTKDGKIGRRTVEKMARERYSDAEYWEKRYNGYRLIRCYSRFNEYNGNWYVSVVMYRSGDSPPNWSTEEWLDFG